MKRKRKQKGGISISMDNEIRKLQALFSDVEDHRASNCSHKLNDILMCGYAMFSLKHPSLLSFENQNETEKGNLQDIFGISKICSDSQTRLVLDKVSPEFIRTYFSSKFKELDEVGLGKEYEYRIGSKKYLICSNDGVQHFSSNSICCDKCLEKKHKDGSCTYCHQMLCSALVHPDKRELFIIWMPNL
jgi:hypothetical protein